MSKEEAIATIKLLAALESWLCGRANQIPEYLHEDLCRGMEVLERIILEKNT